MAISLVTTGCYDKPQRGIESGELAETGDDDDDDVGPDDDDDDDDDDGASTSGDASSTGSMNVDDGPDDDDDDDDDPTTTGESTDDGDPETSSSSDGEPLPMPTRIVLYRGPSTNGNVAAAGGAGDARASADALCSDVPEYPAECTEAHAVLSFDAGDEIASMVASFSIPELPVEAPDGTLIDHDFESMLDGELLVSFVDAGLFAGSELYWTGTWADGEVNDYNCEEWTSTMGYSIAANSGNASGWFGAASVMCNQNLPILCACW